MHGTFRRGDVLLVAPTALEAVHPGDVVVFAGPQRNEGAPVVVHRVLARSAAQLVTRGDCSAAPDSQPIGAEHLVGRVLFVQRDGKTRSVWGGAAGRLWVVFLRLRRPLVRVALWPYRVLGASGIVRRLWRPDIVRIHLTTGNGRLVKYVHRRRTVACWWPDEGEFWCRRPYDLIIERPRA